ncbi:MAG: hypothetical protein NZ929_02700 [Aigarchaeota archaeon]|nr:hypothetical protein [Aigarchaeota archaeon]MCX8192305.1 hypothetical protein [Nitrososphaeria archaeon]MDW7986829.1 hypothetical protein [Nitrososphaerota archaeon]
MSDLAEKIRQKLTVDESVMIEQMLDRLSKLLGLTRDGKILIKFDRTKVTTRSLISIYAVGKLMAKQAGYSSEDYVSIDELSRELGIDGKVVGARVSELRREGVLISVERGQYKLNPSYIEYILSEVERQIAQ